MATQYDDRDDLEGFPAPHVEPPGGIFQGPVTVTITVPRSYRVAYCVNEIGTDHLVGEPRGSAQSPVVLRFSPSTSSADDFELGDPRSQTRTRHLALTVQLVEERPRVAHIAAGPLHRFEFTVIAPLNMNSADVVGVANSPSPARRPPQSTPIVPFDLPWNDTIEAVSHLAWNRADDDERPRPSRLALSQREWIVAQLADVKHENDGRGWTFAHAEPLGETSYRVGAAVSDGILVAQNEASPYYHAGETDARLMTRSCFSFTLGSAFIVTDLAGTSPIRKRPLDVVPVAAVEITSVDAAPSEVPALEIQFTADAHCVISGDDKGHFGAGASFIVTLVSTLHGDSSAVVIHSQSRTVVAATVLADDGPFRVVLRSVGWHPKDADVFRALSIS